MRFPSARSAFAAFCGMAAFGILSCSDSPVAPRSIAPGDPSLTVTTSAGPVVISQIYGAGGNSGATLKNDYVELFNPGAAAVSVGGWSVQYVSAAGTGTWAVTPLPAGASIPAGGYYLVQESQGAGGTVNLPTPDASGTIAMSGTDGKVALVNNTTALAGACPTGTASAIDIVSYGSGNCSLPGGAAAQVLTVTTADFRNLNGCAYTGNASADFTRATAAPRNSASPVSVCSGGPPPTPVFTSITITGPTALFVGTPAQYTATGLDQFGNPMSPQPTITWTSSQTAAVTIDVNSGLATPVAGGTSTITATSGAITKTLGVTVTALTNMSGKVLISQIYGGGGNSGATLKNDFIELFNPGPDPVSLAGWSVQQTSAAGTGTWSVTPLSGVIQPNHYYLVQESAGTGGSVDLPTPDATGTIAMGATSGKVLLSQTSTAQTGACPSGIAIVDIVGYASGTSCGQPADAPANATADIRLNGGCFVSSPSNPSTDFAVGTPTPRNSATAAHSCVLGPLNHVSLTAGTTSILAGGTVQLTAKAFDADGNTLVLPFTFSSADPSTVTVSPAGLVTGIAATENPVIVTAETTQGGVTMSASVLISVTNPGVINWLDVSYNVTDNTGVSNLPYGFQAKIFLKARETRNGTIVPATFAVEAVDADLVSVLADGGLSDGPMIASVGQPAATRTAHLKITATPTGGGPVYVFITTATTSLTIPPAFAAPASIYGNNDEFGDPTPVSASTPDDFLIRRNQYVLSYNQSRGTPNWVSYELDPRQANGAADRCNCFTSDSVVPAAKRIYYTDYTGGGFDRGHMMPSADRTAGNEDNAASFYMTNMVPQQADLNQGVWANLEDALRDSVRAGRAAYIIVGPLYSRSHGLTFLNGGSKVAIPDSTWKIALIGPRNGANPFTLGSVLSGDDLAGLSVIAVNMPNIAGVRNDPWEKYLTTIDKIEEATGYDFLSLLNTAFQVPLEAGDHAPVPSFVFSGTQDEASPLSFDASASTDPDLGHTDLGRTEALSYQWHFSDGTADVTGKVVSHTFADNGTYSVTLMVTDAFGWQRTTTKTVTINNLNPSAVFSPPSSGVEGTPYTLSLTEAIDPSGADVAAGLTYAFDCGGGTYSAAQTFASFNCTAPDNGTYTVRAKVMDKDGGSAEYSGHIAVANANPTAVLSAPSAVEGSPIHVSLTSATDPSPVDAAALQFAFDCGSGYGAPSSSSTASCPTDDDGTRTVRGKVLDKDGGFNEYSTVVTITNAPPTATFGAPLSVSRGGSIGLSLTNATDPSSVDVAAGFTFAFDCGTGGGFVAAPSATASCPAPQAGARVVRARITDKNAGFTEYTATVNVVAEPTALVRHAPQLNANLEGSLEMFLGENVTMNGTAKITGSLYVPGTPTVRKNGNPLLGATVDAFGSVSPSNYIVTLNGGVSLGTLVRRTDAATIPSVGAPATPTGTRNVQLNSPSDQVGDWSTVRNFTMNGNVPAVTMPGGVYGEITVNGSNTLVLGSPGVTTSYDVQRLTLNGQSVIQVAGPVVVTVGNAVQVNSSIFGATNHPEWLTLRLSQGGLTINSNVTFAGVAIVPNGQVTVNGASSLTGGLAADGLVLNGNSLVKITVSVP